MRVPFHAGIAATLAVACVLAPVVPARGAQPPAAVAAVPAASSASAASVASPLPYTEAVVARFPAPAVTYPTPALAPRRASFTGNDELLAHLRGLAPAAFVEIGRSATGQPIGALQLGRGTGLPRVLLVGGQHGDEPAASEALLAVAGLLTRPRDEALSLADVLDNVEVVVVPRLNPDGAERFTRRNAGGHDVNRDHLLLNTPEAQALAALVARLRPVLVADVHEYRAVGPWPERFGALPRHDVLFQHATVPNLAPGLAEAGRAWFREPLARALQAEGLRFDDYHTPSSREGDRRVAMGSLNPDALRNVQGLRNAVTLLLEGRGIGIGRLHFERRVHAQVVAVRTVLRAAAERAVALAALQRAADAHVAAQACGGTAAVLATRRAEERELLLIDAVSGADVAVRVPWRSSLAPRVLVERPRPCAYWLAPGAGAVVARLRELGLRVDLLAAPVELDAEGWQETMRGEAPGEEGEGRMLQIVAETRPLRLVAPAGSYLVTLDQPLANLAVAALEPDHPRSYFATRLLPSLEAAARVMRPPAASAPP